MWKHEKFIKELKTDKKELKNHLKRIKNTFNKLSK